MPLIIQGDTSMKSNYKNSSKEKRQHFLKVAAGFIINMVGFSVASMLVFTLPAYFSNKIVGQTIGLLASITAITITFAITTHIILRKRFIDYHFNMTPYHLRRLLFGLLVGIMTFLLISLPLYISGLYQLKHTGSWQQMLLGFILFAGVGYAEEVLCRGYLQHELLKLGPIKALFLTSGIFSILHFLNPGFSFIGFVNLILAGVFMGAAMYATKSLMTAIGIHITWNWTQGSFLGISVSGNSVDGLFSTTVQGNNALLTGGDFGTESSILCTIILVAGSALFLLYAKKKRTILDF